MDGILFLLDFYDMWIFYATSTPSRQKNLCDDSIVRRRSRRSTKTSCNSTQKISKVINFAQLTPLHFLKNEICDSRNSYSTSRAICTCNPYPVFAIDKRGKYRAEPFTSPRKKPNISYAICAIAKLHTPQYFCLRKSGPLQAQPMPFPACHKNTTQLTIFFNFDQFIASQETKPPALPARPLNVHPSGKMYGSLRQFSK